MVEKHTDGYVAYPFGMKGVCVAEGDSSEQVLAEVRSAVQFHVETFGTDAVAATQRAASPDEQQSAAFLEIQAAVLASNGEPAEAAQLIEKARASILSRTPDADTARLNAQLAEYQAGRAWTEH